MPNTLKLGVARAIITPAVGAQLYGYSPDVFSTSVNDDLTATAYCFEQNGTKAMMVSITLCSIETSICDSLRAMIEEIAGIPAANTFICCTHTHSGPNLSGAVGWGDIDSNYLNTVFIPAFRDAVQRASDSLIPVKMGMAQGDSYVGINRRELTADNTVVLGQNPWGCFNPKMTVLSFADENGNVVANMIHYGAHGTASGRNTEITRDWSGVMIDELERLTGGITAFFNGPEGDVGPRMISGKTVGKMTVKDAMVHGGLAAHDAVRIFRQIRAYHDVDLATANGTLEIPLSPRISREEAEAIGARFTGKQTNNRAGQQHYSEMVLASYEEGYVEQPARYVSQSLIRLGDVAFAAFPFELFSEIGMRIDGASAIPYVLNLALTNGAESYLATQDALCRGGYEIIMHKIAYIQPYRDDADFALIKGTLENLKQIGG